MKKNSLHEFLFSGKQKYMFEPPTLWLTVTQTNAELSTKTII